MEGGFKGADKHSNLAKFLRSFRSTLIQQPKALLIVSAHWEEEKVSVLGFEKEIPLYFDYYGFPKETYQLKYPAPVNPEISERVLRVLDSAGFSPQKKVGRGWDHGVFVPLLVNRDIFYVKQNKQNKNIDSNPLYFML